MLLSARMLDRVSNVNTFDYVNQIAWTEGDTVDFYFQLIDASQDRTERGFVPAGRRYMPVAGATLLVTVDNINDAVKISDRVAVQPFPVLDPSIWRVSVTATDKIRGTCALRLKLTESGRLTRGSLEQALLINSAGTM